MKYISATFFLSCSDGMIQVCHDVLSSLLAAAGFEAFEENDEGLKGYAQAELFDRNATDNIIKSFPIENVMISYEVKNVADTDWNKAWEQDGFEPITVADKVAVFDARRPMPDDLSDGMIKIGIKTEMAFGTGTHQTTRMMIKALTETDLSGMRILDCGCGTGILGIAASKLGADSVEAYDIDEWSVKNTELNARNNGVENLKVHLGDADVLKQIGGTFNIILANINRNIIINDLPTFVSKAKTDTIFFLSGFFRDDIPVIEAETTKLNLEKRGSDSCGKWAFLYLVKK